MDIPVDTAAAKGTAAEGTAATAAAVALAGGGGSQEEEDGGHEELHPALLNWVVGWCVQMDLDALRRRGLPYL